MTYTSDMTHVVTKQNLFHSFYDFMLNALITWLFVQSLMKVDNETIEALHSWESTSNQWITHTYGK